MYVYVKRTLDLILSLILLPILSLVMAALSIWIKVNSPGPVLFKQQRVGKNCELFMIYKFRTMRTDTPKDTPTHLLENPEQYITRSGRVMRKFSLDELPQLFNILKGDMSFIGPRPALWNQYDLIAEREKHHANDVLPGMTGWAQINGRDELPIPDKARLDGEYAQRFSFMMDLKIFIMSFVRVFKASGVAEGTPVELDYSIMKSYQNPNADANGRRLKVLITGEKGYVARNLHEYLLRQQDIDTVSLLNVRTDAWMQQDFSGYDCVVHLAAIVHREDLRKAEELYQHVNVDLSVALAEKAKEEHVPHFVFMSSMSVYGLKDSLTRKCEINADTPCEPESVYGRSKLHAEVLLQKMQNDAFPIAIVRAPRVYGIDCTGSYRLMRKLVLKFKLMPKHRNERSMIYIENLCAFFHLLILSGSSGLFFPQDPQPVCTYEMTQHIAKQHRSSLFCSVVFNPLLYIANVFTTKIRKAFGNLTYAQELSKHFGGDYQIYDLESAIEMTESRWSL